MQVEEWSVTEGNGPAAMRHYLRDRCSKQGVFPIWIEELEPQTNRYHLKSEIIYDGQQSSDTKIINAIYSPCVLVVQLADIELPKLLTDAYSRVGLASVTDPTNANILPYPIDLAEFLRTGISILIVWHDADPIFLVKLESD